MIGMTANWEFEQTVRALISSQTHLRGQSTLAWPIKLADARTKRTQTNLNARMIAIKCEVI